MQILTVTQGSNGYPSRTYPVETADTYSQLQAIQQRDGGEIVLLKKRAGWSCWENMGRQYSNLMGKNPSDSDTVLNYKPGASIEEIAYNHVVGDYNSAAIALADIHPEATIDQCLEILKNWKQRIQEIIDAIDEDQETDIWMGNPDPTYINYTITPETITYRDDVYTYRLAIQPI